MIYKTGMIVKSVVLVGLCLPVFGLECFEKLDCEGLWPVSSRTLEGTASCDNPAGQPVNPAASGSTATACEEREKMKGRKKSGVGTGPASGSSACGMERRYYIAMNPIGPVYQVEKKCVVNGQTTKVMVNAQMFGAVALPVPPPVDVGACTTNEPVQDWTSCDI